MAGSIQVSDRTKEIVVTLGPYKLFGDDKDRREMTSQERIELFDQQWRMGLAAAVESAQVCDADRAHARISEKSRRYFDRSQEHREFRFHDSMEFIAQIRPVKEGGLELTQLWFIRSSDLDPKVLYVRFSSVEDRERFGELANRLGWKDEELGLRLLMQFLENCEGR